MDDNFDQTNILAKASQYLAETTDSDLCEISELLLDLAYRVKSEKTKQFFRHLNFNTGSCRAPTIEAYYHREMAQAAVYILHKYLGLNLSRSCKKIADLSGINIETLRTPLKGANLHDFEETYIGKRTLEAIEYLRTAGCGVCDDLRLYRRALDDLGVDDPDFFEFEDEKIIEVNESFFR